MGACHFRSSGDILSLSYIRRLVAPLLSPGSWKHAPGSGDILSATQAFASTSCDQGSHYSVIDLVGNTCVDESQPDVIHTWQRLVLVNEIHHCWCVCIPFAHRDPTCTEVI